MKNNRNYNKWAFENSIRKSKSLGSKGSLFYIVLFSAGIILLVVEAIKEGISKASFAYLPFLVLLCIGEVVFVKEFLKEKAEEKKKKNKE